MSDAMIAERVGRYEVGLRLREAANMGHTVIQSSHVGALHYVDIAPEGTATLYNYAASSPTYDEASVVSGLQLAGVKRRHGLRHTLVEAIPQDIQRGDRVVLERDGESFFTTLSINRLLTE